MNERLHVVHGALSLDVGGLEKVLVSLVRASILRGEKASVICIEKPGELADDVLAAGATLISLDKPAGRHPEFVRRAADILDRLKPDVIHTHQIGAAWYLGQAAKLQLLPVLHTEHGNQFARDANWKARVKSRLFYRATGRFVNRFCCVSADIARAVTRWGTIPKAKVEVVPNGIEIDMGDRSADRIRVRNELGIPSDAKVIGTVGRLAVVKRQDRILTALAELVNRHPDLRVILVGEGPERGRLQNLANELGVLDRVHFVGYQSHPSRFLRAMDIFALTSQSEGLPISLLEAWAAQLPVVCTRVGGLPDVISDGINGLLVPDGDGASLVHALAKCFDQSTAHRLGAGGFQTVRDSYSLETMIKVYSDKYLALISASRGPA